MEKFENGCVITDTLKSRFCKDMSLPIKVFKEPYFMNFLTLFDPFYNCLESYNKFVELVNKYGGQSAFLDAYDNLKDTIIAFLKNKESMIKFSQTEDMQKYSIQNVGYPQSDIYKDTNDGCFFVSIDMKKANFTAISHYDPSIVEGKETYEDFIRMFTDEEYFVSSKYIRQVIFGNINPKRQVTYERYLMDKVLTKLLENSKEKGFYSDDLVAFFSTDEIVLRVSDKYIVDNSICVDFKNFVEEVVAWACGERINVRATYFKLKKVMGTKGYVKFFDNAENTFEFKCMDAIVMPFVCRYFLKQNYTDMDTVFVFEGRLAKLLDIPQVSVV